MGNRRVARRGVISLMMAVIASLALASPAFGGWQGEGGYKNCGDYISYLHARYNDKGQLTPPGSAYTYLYYYYDGLWHTTELNGDYSGDWAAYGLQYLDMNGTYARCRNFG